MHAIKAFVDVLVGRALGRAKQVLGLVPLIGIGLHSFLDGVVYSVSFEVSRYSGALMATGMVLHEFPEGIVTCGLLVREGLPRARALLLALLAAAATTPAGSLASYPLVSSIDELLLGSLFALSAGILIYL